MDKIVVYYSLEGNTRFIAECIGEHFELDFQELKPVKELSKVEPIKHIWGGKQVMMRESPQLKEYDLDLHKYDLIFLGTPVWSFNFSPPIRSFLKENSISGKNIVLFCTHMGMPGKTLRNLEKELAGNNIKGAFDYKNVLKNKEKVKKKLQNDISKLEGKI